jgi:hypothetical protein
MALGIHQQNFVDILRDKETIRLFDEKRNRAQETMIALQKQKPEINILRKQLYRSVLTPEQQEKFDAEEIRWNAMRKWMYKKFPKDKAFFELLDRELINNPEKMQVIIDNVWDVAKHFPEINQTYKIADMSSLLIKDLEYPAFVKEFIVIHKARHFLSSLKWTAAWNKDIICVRKRVFWYIDFRDKIKPIHPKMKAFLDTQWAAWNKANAQIEDIFCQYIATLLWVEYDPTEFWSDSKNSIIYRALMYLGVKELWKNFRNVSYKWEGKYWTPWDMYFNIKWKQIEKLQIMRTNDRYQQIDRFFHVGDASISLVAW